MGDKVRFKRGSLQDLPVQLSPGTVYITTNEGGMYVDTGSSRIRIGDFIPVETVNDLPLNGHAYETALYYIKEGNILARWKAGIDGLAGKWIQINKAGVVGVTDKTGTSGNIISNIELVTNPIGQMLIEVTRTTVASSDDLEALRIIVENHTSTLNTLTGDSTGSIVWMINAAKEALIDGATNYTTFKQIEDALSALIGRVQNVEEAVDILNGPTTTSGSIAYQIAAALAGIELDVDQLKTDVSNLQTTVNVHDTQLHWETFTTL